jgi:hypothetical protein
VGKRRTKSQEEERPGYGPDFPDISVLLIMGQAVCRGNTREVRSRE